MCIRDRYQPLPPGMVEVAEVFAYTCPVSYTHLDVYKRQVQVRVIMSSPKLPTLGM